MWWKLRSNEWNNGDLRGVSLWTIFDLIAAHKTKTTLVTDITKFPQVHAIVIKCYLLQRRYASTEERKNIQSRKTEKLNKYGGRRKVRIYQTVKKAYTRHTHRRRSQGGQMGHRLPKKIWKTQSFCALRWFFPNKIEFFAWNHASCPPAKFFALPKLLGWLRHWHSHFFSMRGTYKLNNSKWSTYYNNAKHLFICIYFWEFFTMCGDAQYLAYSHETLSHSTTQLTMYTFCHYLTLLCLSYLQRMEPDRMLMLCY